MITTSVLTRFNLFIYLQTHRSVLENNKYRMLLLLLFSSHSAALNSRDNEFFTPLLLGCCTDNAEGVKLLLKHGADHMDTDDRENSCIRLAAEYNQVEVVRVLLKHLKKTHDTSLIDQPDNLGLAPLHIAAQKGHSDIVKVRVTW